MKLKSLIATALLFSCPMLCFSTPNNSDSDFRDGIRIKPVKGTVALTFDDGPTEEFTPKILAILKKYHIKATFFMVGMSMEKHPEIVRQVLQDGHSINNHSMTHPLLITLNDEQLIKEVEEPAVIINKMTGKRPLCMRYPFGTSNEHVKDITQQHGMAPVSIGFNSFDYTHPGVDKIVRWVLKNAYSGQVILMHDGFADRDRQQTVEALPKIIEGIQKKGLGFGQICNEKITAALR